MAAVGGNEFADLFLGIPPARDVDLGADALICLKALAYVNLIKQRQSGGHVNSDDLKKHRRDVVSISKLKFLAARAFAGTLSGPSRRCVERIFQLLERMRLTDRSSRSRFRRRSLW